MNLIKSAYFTLLSLEYTDNPSSTGHHASGALGTPVRRPQPVDSCRRPNILRITWSNMMKNDGKRKCRACIDESKRSAPHLRDFVQTYMPLALSNLACMCLFFALAAVNGLLITTADTENAFQQSPPPTEQCYLEIDDAYRSWYKKRFPARMLSLS
jgi:hypothetical protein